jgi:hypothetical protein
MRSLWNVRLCAVLAVAFVAGIGIATPDAEARRGRSGPSPQQIAAMKKAMAQQAEMEKKLAAAQQKKDQQTIARFDLNGNGRIDGPQEKGPWDKFWREVNLGKTAHPYASISPNDIKPDAPKTAAKKK